MRVIIALLSVPLIVLSSCLCADPITADGQAIKLVPQNGIATHRNSFDQPEGFAQTCFALQGTPTWRREHWQDLVVPAGSAVVYKFMADAPMSSARLSFSAWAAEHWDIGVHASPDGQTWSTLFTYDKERMGNGNRIQITRPLQDFLSADRKEFYVKFAPARGPMLLYEFSVRATFGETAPESHASEYTAGRVPPAGRMRYVIYYGDAGIELMDFLHDAWINFLHWHGPFYGYSGLPKRDSLPLVLESCRQTVQQAHENGAMIIFYVGPVFSYGDVEKRSQIFAMYDKQWEEYREYLGERPGQDVLDWTQRDPDGKPRPYVWEGNQGYYLCINSPAVRQYDKGLLKLINATGADGVFYDGPAFAGGLCYCQNCVTGFRKYLDSQFSAEQRQTLFGVEDAFAVQPPKQAGTPLWAAWRRFHALSLQDFLRDTRDAIRAVNPNFIMTANYCMWEGDPYGALRGASEDLELWSQVLDVVFEEGCFEKTPRTADGVKYSNAANYKYLLAASHGKPPTELAYMTKATSDEAQGNLARVAVAEGLMNACAWQVPYGQTNEAGRKAIAQYHAFQKANEELLVGQVPYTNVGVLASMTQGYCDQASYPMAVSRFLTDHHIDHRMVIDEELTAGPPAGLDVLVLPRTPCLSKAQVNNLQAFAREHKLVLIGPCGTHDEWGRPSGAPLADALREVRDNVVQLPTVSLPMVGRKGLSAEAVQALTPLLQVFAHTPPLVTLVADDRVEFSAYRTTADRYTIHLVNFDVGLDGQVQDKQALSLRIKLPRGYTPQKLELRSPDSAPMKLDYELLVPGPASELLTRIPKLHIYDLLVIEGKQKRTGEGEEGARVEIAGDRSVVLGGKAQLRVRVIGPQGTRPEMVKVDAKAPPGAVLKLTGQDVAASREVAVTKMYEFRPPPSAEVGQLLAVDFAVTVGGPEKARLTQRALVQVLPPARVRFLVPQHLNAGSGKTRVVVPVANLSDAPLDVKVWFVAPTGWQFNPKSLCNKAQPHAETMFASVLSGPAEFSGPVPLRVRIAAATGSGLWVTDLEATPCVLSDFKWVACQRAHAKPNLDGKVEEPAWEAAVPLVLSACREDMPPSQSTEAFTLWDDNALYFAFRCRDDNMDKVPAKITTHGGEVWLDDDVEIFLDPDDRHTDYLHVAVNPVGTVYTNPPLSGVIAAATRSSVDWQVEIAIPWSGLNVDADDGTVWAFDLFRTRQPREGQQAPELSALFPTGSSFHVPQKFGHLVFKR